MMGYLNLLYIESGDFGVSVVEFQKCRYCIWFMSFSMMERCPMWWEGWMDSESYPTWPLIHVLGPGGEDKQSWLTWIHAQGLEWIAENCPFKKKKRILRVFSPLFPSSSWFSIEIGSSPFCSSNDLFFVRHTHWWITSSCERPRKSLDLQSRPCWGIMVANHPFIKPAFFWGGACPWIPMKSLLFEWGQFSVEPCSLVSVQEIPGKTTTTKCPRLPVISRGP